MGEKKDKIVQSITAYRCRICEKYRDENLLVKSEKNKDPIDLQSLLYSFFEYIKICQIDKYTNRALLLSHPAECAEIGNAIQRILIQPNAGKALENFSVVNYRTNALKNYEGAEHSALYTHNILFYLNETNNVFVFHHYGQSGCKTAFQNIFNEFLAPMKLIAHLDVLMSSEMFEKSNRYIPEKVSLITTYSDLSTDKADNIRSKPRKKVEQEIIISLNAPRAKNIKSWFKNIIISKLSIEELKNVLIKDGFPGDFEDAKLTLKFGKVTRRISLSEFAGVIAEYDITEKLKLFADGGVIKESLYELANEYAFQFFE